MAPPKKPITKAEKPLKKEPEIAAGKSTSPSRRPKSPSRQKSPGRSKSPSRTKSDVATTKPSRRKSSDLSKSPTRTGKSPTRVGHLTPTRRSPIRGSPSRASNPKAESAIPVLRKKQIVVETDSDSDTADEKIAIKEKPKAAVRGRTRTDLIEKVEFRKEPSTESTSSSQVLKRITRSQQKEVERIVHLKHFEPAAKKLSEFSDEDELTKESSQEKSTKLENGFLSLVFLMVCLPALGIFLFATCNEKNCSFSRLSENLSIKVSNLPWHFNLRASAAYVGFFIFVAAISALPFGGRKVTSLPDKHEKFVYTTNGLLCTVLCLALTFVLEYKNISVSKFVLAHQFQFYLTSVVIGVLLSVYVYIRSFYVPISALNPDIINKNRVSNFYMGREIHPRIFGRLDLKMFVYKVTAFCQVMIIAAWLIQNFEATKNAQGIDNELIKRLLRLNPTLVVFCALLTVRILDTLIFERTWITSREVQQEGFGYHMAVNHIIYPFISVLTIKYIVEHNVHLAYWKLALISSAYLIGIFISRASNNQKDAFRKNPYNPSFSHLDTIPTAHGKKLLSSGFWGFVRHPNYLGDIIAELSLVPFEFWAPLVVLRYINVLYLIRRAKQDNDHCKQKYGVAWDRYCNKVRYLLVPKVF